MYNCVVSPLPIQGGSKMTVLVYEHITPNEKRYIGISKNIHERWRKQGLSSSYNKYFTKAVKKYGWDNIEHNIVAICDTYEEACNIEIEYISICNSTDPLVGYNITPGGELLTGENHPAFGRFVSKDERRRRSIKAKEVFKNRDYTGKNNSFYGKRHSDETKRKICKANSGKRSDEYKRKMAEVLGTPAFNIYYNGEYIETMYNQSECARKYNLHVASVNRCLLGKQHTTNGYTIKPV